MKSEGKIWRFWGIFLAAVTALWAWMGFLVASDASPYDQFRLWFLLRSYVLIAVVVCLGARFQNYELRGGDERRERNRAILMRWILGAYGIGLIARAIREFTKPLPQQGTVQQILGAGFLLVIGAFVLYNTFKTKPAKSLTTNS